MWILEFLIFLMTGLIIWTLFGYFVFLYFVSLLRNKKTYNVAHCLPTVTVIIPCYNEEKDILTKIENLKDTDYPSDLIEFVFVDGGSTDRTVDIISEHIEGLSRFKLKTSERKGKINQINSVLSDIKSKIVVNTDVDAILQRDTIKKMILEFSEPMVLVVGAFCKPANTIDIERYFWKSQNKGRLIESNAYTSFIVVAPCYAYRRWLIDKFPQDVVADDIYIASHANTLGGRTVYLSDALVTETRCPKTYSEFLSHKFRKSNAYLRESLRFLYRLPEMSGMLKMMFITKIMQQLLLPYALLSWGLLAGVMLTLFRFDIVVICFIAIIMSFLITNRVFASVKLVEEESFSIFTVVKGYILTVFILLATGISYPFYKQDSSYSRLQTETHREC